MTKPIWHWGILTKGHIWNMILPLHYSLPPHKITMFYGLNNFLKLDTILNGKSFGLRNCVSWQHVNNIGENNNRL
jgi:hypothetical protein